MLCDRTFLALRTILGTGRARAGHFSLASEERAGHTPFGLSNCTNYYVSVADSLLGSGRTHTATHRHSLLSTMTIESNRVRAQQHGYSTAYACEHAPQSVPAAIRAARLVILGASTNAFMIRWPTAWRRRYKVGEACQPRMSHGQHVCMRAFACPGHRTHLV